MPRRPCSDTTGVLTGDMGFDKDAPCQRREQRDHADQRLEAESTQQHVLGYDGEVDPPVDSMRSEVRQLRRRECR